MTQRKRTKSNDNPFNIRQNLPRRCKDVQPYYAIDIEFEEDDDDPDRRSLVRKKGLGSSKRSASDTSRAQEDNQQQAMPLSILSWLFDLKVVKEQEIIWCKNRTDETAVEEGRLTRAGIICCCCRQFLSVSDFWFHKGDLFADKCYENMFIGETGVSLLTCMIEAWNKHSVPARDGYHHVVRRPRVTDNHDDSCLICADGGDLMCCEKCPSTYHPRCIGLQDIPRGEWQCPYCRCKYCDQDDSSGILLTCFQCLKKYHFQCSEASKEKILGHLNPPKTPFCGKSCLLLYRKLEDMLGRSVPLIGGLSWTLVRRMDLDAAAQNSEDVHLRAKCNVMVALAAQLMEDSFDTIVDRQTRTNMVQSIVYSCGSNFTRTNFSRFYTAVLDCCGLVVTAASLRMPSPTLAEIPFIATTESWRNRGMCNLLLAAIHSALHHIGVEHIVIPSAQGSVRNWKKKKFGFTPLDDDIKAKITTLNTVMFPKTVRLQKAVTRGPLNDLNSPPESEEHVGDHFWGSRTNIQM